MNRGGTILQKGFCKRDESGVERQATVLQKQFCKKDQQHQVKRCHGQTTPQVEKQGTDPVSASP